MRFIYHYLLLGLGLFLFACSSNADKNNADQDIDPETLLHTSFNGKLFSIPSPVLTTLLFKELNAPYTPSLLLDKPQVDQVTDEYSRSLYLGLLAADLGYVSFYNDNNRIVKYLVGVEKLASDLGLDKNFNKEFMQRYEANITKTDSLVQLSSDAFKYADSYLKNNDRFESSLLILIGGWVETIYLASHLTSTVEKPDLVARIGEQKQTLETILSVLIDQNIEEQKPELVKAFKALDATYQNVAMHYKYSEPSIDLENNLTTLNHTISFEVPAKTLEDIKTKIAAIRNLIIK